MKRLLLLFLALATVLSFVACKEDNPIVCEHGDENGDGKCDICATVIGECTHADKEPDGKCDKCGAEVSLPCLHADENTDGKCDKCSEVIGECTHADENGDESCDKCSQDLRSILTVAEAIAICNDTSADKTQRYYIRATVKTVMNAAFGEMMIVDSTGELYVYGAYSADGSVGYAEMEDKPYASDEVLLHCILQSYNGEPEIQNARIIEFKHTELDLEDYAEMSIADARAADAGAKVKLEGVVARITYANGQIPSGVILIDGTSSIYVYSSDVAGRVAIGNRVTVAGSKAYWILGTEMNNAASFGYKGCNQIESAVLISNDESTSNEFDKSWISETTVKELIETPVTEDITTLVYKVTAVVKKAAGNGFTNYYFYDLDYNTETGRGTGEYTYTQCNGSDFAWLDEFDGKVCTVYLTALNAKSTASSCYFRLLPVEVICDEDFEFDTAKAGEHAVKYYGVDQFEKSYTGNPELSLITSVSSTLLGFEGATLTYTSSDTSVIEFASEGGEVVFNCVGAGTATVTITGSYGGVEYSEDVMVEVLENQNYDYISVSDAISADLGETVIVKGIVGPGVTNKCGFYLIDETGVIAVTGDATMFDGLAIGHEVVIQGTRDINIKDETTHCIGQTYLSGCEILANYYGTHDYDTSSFVTDKTLDYIFNLDPMEDYSTTVFLITATVTVEESTYYSNIYLTDGNGTKLRLYSSSSSQYSWLKAYAGQEVTIEVAACNWNDKNYYTGCVLAVVADDGTKTYNTFNFTL